VNNIGQFVHTTVKNISYNKTNLSIGVFTFIRPADNKCPFPFAKKKQEGAPRRSTGIDGETKYWAVFQTSPKRGVELCHWSFLNPLTISG
jgi:hypothetical protein